MKKRIFHNCRWEVMLTVFSGLLLLGFLAWAYNIPQDGQANHKWSWGENIGWQNWGTSTYDGVGVTVASAGLTGYVWAENIGWIKLDYDGVAGAVNDSAVNWGVTNSGGILGGYAWGENIGWINFDTEHSGVVIDSSGYFSGYAWGENVGWINFEHTQTAYIVWTDWTPLVTYTLATTTSKTINVHNNLTIGDGINEVTVTGATYNPTINVDGNIIINATSTFIAPTSSFTIAGDWTNSGTFTHSSGTTTFDGASTSTISDSSNFYNLACITNNKGIVFEAGATTTVSGRLTLTGASGQEIVLRSSVTDSPWFLTAATNTVSYVDVKDSDATSSALAIDATTGGVDSEGNINWLFSAAGITVSGVVYESRGGSNIGADKSIFLKVDGAGDWSASTTAGGVYEITSITGVSAGSTITAWISGDPTYKGTAVTIADDDSSNITGFDIYGGVIIARSDKTSTALTIADMVDYDKDDDSDIHFTATTSPSNLTVDSDSELHIWDSKEFAPGGDITLSYGGAKGDLYIGVNAAFTGSGTSTYSVGGSWTATSGAAFTAASSTVAFTATTTGKTITDGGSSFYLLNFNGSGGEWL